jgi:hypothetical protein
MMAATAHRPRTDRHSSQILWPSRPSWRRSGRGEYCRLVSRRKGPRPVTIRLSRGRIEPESREVPAGPRQRGRHVGAAAPSLSRWDVSVTCTRSADPK